MESNNEEKRGEVTNKDSLNKTNLKMLGYGFVGFIAIVVVGGVAVCSYLAYHSPLTGKISSQVASVLNLPMMSVNGETVSFRNYLSDMHAIETYQAYLKTTSAGAPSLTPENMSDQVLSRLAGNIIIEQAAKKYGVKAEKADLDQLKAALLSEYKTEAAVSAELKKRYGWDLASYEKNVMTSYVLQQKVSEKLSSDPAAREEKRKAADDVLSQIKAGGDFAALAKQYGSDSTKDQGGDLGWFKKGDMVPQFEAAAFVLKAGEVTSAPVETTYGYHLIKLVDRRTVSAPDTSGKTVKQEEIRASHILFAFPTLEKYMSDQLKTTKIKLYINVHNPFKVTTSTPK